MVFGIRSSNKKKAALAEAERIRQEQLALEEQENAIEEVTTVVQPVGEFFTRNIGNCTFQTLRNQC